MADELGIIEYAEDILTAEPPAPLPDGDYPFTVESVAKRESQTSGNEYFAIGIRIPVEAYPADYPVDNNPDGVLLTYNRVGPANNPRARYRMRKWLEAIGAPGGNAINPMDWIGLSGVAVVGVREYEGVDQNEVKSVKAE